MSQDSSLTQSGHSVRQALTAYNFAKRQGGFGFRRRASKGDSANAMIEVPILRGFLPTMAVTWLMLG